MTPPAELGIKAKASKTAKREKAPALEVYPVDTTAKSTSNIFTGTASTFAHAGFKEVARRAAVRPIMRSVPRRQKPPNRCAATNRAYLVSA